MERLQYGNRDSLPEVSRRVVLTVTGLVRQHDIPSCVKTDHLVNLEYDVTKKRS